MRPPYAPPTIDELFKEAVGANTLQKIFASAVDSRVTKQYIHWDKLVRYTPPAGLSHEEWWLGIKFGRMHQLKPMPLKDKTGSQFVFSLPDPIPERLHQIDLGIGGFIQTSAAILNPETKDQYYVRSLIEEAITSSQLEGATTTRQVAKEMIQSNRQPRDRSERMILNNYGAMKRIASLKEQPLTKELIFEIHKQVTYKTLDDESAAGRLRRSDEGVTVADQFGHTFHVPPPAVELDDRMQAMCDFANGKTPNYFIHPAIRSIMLHFWLGYDHPFVDGNGRTARTLFYWSMLRSKFWLCEFITISTILRKAPSKYSRSFLYTETDSNDLTYFLIYHLEVIRRAVEELHAYINRKTQQVELINTRLHGVSVFNHRQRMLLEHALRHPHQDYTIESHRMSHNVVHQTARNDLWELEQRDLLSADKIGRTWHFTPVRDLEDKLFELSNSN